MAHYYQWLYNKSQSDDTIYTYHSTLTHFFACSAHGGPAKSPERYTREDVLDFIHHPSFGMRNRGLPPAPGTVNARLTHITSFYRFASTYPSSDHPIFDRVSPTAGLAFGKVDRKYRALSLGELERLFAAIPTDTVQGKRDRAIFLFYLWTARRRAEIANLRWGDLEYGVIVEKGTRRNGWLYHFRGKGHKTEDDIAELPHLAKAALDVYLEASGRTATMRPESPLFVAWDKRQRLELPLSHSVFSYQLKRYARAAGLDEKRISLHSFRHSASKLRYEAGEDILSLKNLLRHVSLETTFIYVQGLMGTADSAAKLLEEQFRKFNV